MPQRALQRSISTVDFAPKRPRMRTLDSSGSNQFFPSRKVAFGHIGRRKRSSSLLKNSGFVWDRRPPLAGIKLAEARTEVLQNRPHQLPDFPQRMQGGYPRLRRDVGKQPTLIPKASPHGALNDS